MNKNKLDKMDSLERFEITDDTRRNTINSLNNFIKVLTELGYNEHTILENLDDMINEVTNGKMYLEESDTLNSIATIEATKR